MLLVYTNSDALLDLVNNVREDVVELFLDGMRDAAPDRTAVEQYLIKTNFQWPASAPKRRAQPEDYWDLMMIDPERLKPAILKQLKAASIEESVKNKIAEDVYAAVMKAVIKEVPRHEFAPYDRDTRHEFAPHDHDKSNLDKILADISALGGRCGGCGAREVASVCRHADTGEPLELLCPRCLGAFKDAPADPGKVWEVVYPAVKTTIDR